MATFVSSGTTSQPQPVVSIVDPKEIMTSAEMLNEVHLFAVLFSELNDPFEALRWCACRRLVANTMICDKCSIPSRLTVDVSCIDGRVWRCPYCSSKRSVRHRSMFFASRLTIRQVMLIVYGWVNEWTQAQIARECMCSKYHTVNEWFNFCRDICEQWLEINPQQIGGVDVNFDAKIVEVGDSKFFHRKKQRKQWPSEEHWIFIGVEHGTGKCFLVEAPNRSEQTIRDLTLKWILPGTYIISDGWTAYRNIEEWSGGIYSHRTISQLEYNNDNSGDNNHQTTAESTGSTRNVASIWVRLKRKIRHRFVTNDDLLPSHLHEFIWRNTLKDKENMFENFLLAIKCVYGFNPEANDQS